MSASTLSAATLRSMLADMERRESRAAIRAPLNTAFATLKAAGLPRRAAAIAIRSLNVAKAPAPAASVSADYVPTTESERFTHKGMPAAQRAAHAANWAWRAANGNKWPQESGRFYATIGNRKAQDSAGWHRFQYIVANPGCSRKELTDYLETMFRAGNLWAGEDKATNEINHNLRNGMLRFEIA